MKDVRDGLDVNLWRNSAEVVRWFKNLPNKRMSFIGFDVVEFYPSINESLLDKAINWSKSISEMSEHEIKCIKLAKKSIMFFNGEPWTKKGKPFDVPMGSYDGAECCELVGLYMLHSMRGIKAHTGLYRDDGLMAVGSSPKEIERISQEVQKIYRKEGLRITIEANRKVVPFLDLKLDIANRTYEPYLKEGNQPMYVNTQSNHPPAVIKAIPTGINHRLAQLSISKEAFDRNKEPYQRALIEGGYSHILEYYEVPLEPKIKKRAARNVIYFIPPYDKSVCTNVGQQFLHLVGKCFPKGNPLNKCFNRNSVKISYRTMPNIGKKIDQHNGKIGKNAENDPEKPEKSTKKMQL